MIYKDYTKKKHFSKIFFMKFAAKLNSYSAQNLPRKFCPRLRGRSLSLTLIASFPAVTSQLKGFQSRAVILACFLRFSVLVLNYGIT